MAGMRAARLLVVKPLSLTLIMVVAAGCASDGPPSQPRYVGPSAPHPLNVEPPRDTARTGPAQTATAPPATPPPPAALHPDSAPIGAWLDPGAASPVPVREAVAVLAPTPGSRVTGLVRFRDDGAAVEVTASVAGLPGSVHAYHVHVYGDCSSPDAESAGPHFHFTGSSFDEDVAIVTGNLGELRPGDARLAEHRARVPATLVGRYSIIGRAVVVHERGNDPTAPPEGAAGKRLACGVIGLTGPLPAQQTARH